MLIYLQINSYRYPGLHQLRVEDRIIPALARVFPLKSGRNLEYYLCNRAVIDHFFERDPDYFVEVEYHAAIWSFLLDRACRLTVFLIGL